MSSWQFLILNIALAIIAVILITIALRLYDILNKLKFVPDVDLLSINVDRIRTDVRNIREDIRVESIILSDIKDSVSVKKSCKTCNYGSQFCDRCLGCELYPNKSNNWEAKK